jgi:phenylacetyl-CoA:acceptor oxidoreductase 27-kDa subunit
MRWGMVIDLKKCVGCYACSAACKAESGMPQGVCRSKLVIRETDIFPPSDKVKVKLPLPCNHCEEPQCIEICPTEATSKRVDAIVMVDYDKCMGCGLCVVACPYRMRSLVHNQKRPSTGKKYLHRENSDKMSHHLPERVTVKCNFCMNRIDLGLKNGLKPGVDREATPACVNACKTRARYFGDVHDTESEVCNLIRESKIFQLHPEFGSQPSVYYLQNGFTFFDI